MSDQIPSPPKANPKYFLSERQVTVHGARLSTVGEFLSFELAWEAAIELFNFAGFHIVGCHLEPELGPHKPHYVEFFVVGKPNIHETYVIHAREA